MLLSAMPQLFDIHFLVTGPKVQHINDKHGRDSREDNLVPRVSPVGEEGNTGNEVA